MRELEYQYNEITQKREKIIEEIKKLEETAIIKKYLELTKLNEELIYDQEWIYKNMMLDKYKLCNHILVCSRIDYDKNEGNSYRNYGCIKCGLDTYVYNLPKECQDITEQVMYNYLNGFGFNRLTDFNTEITCDLELATAIYHRIKKTYPEIDDRTTIEYFKASIHNIRNKERNEERKKSRIKRLSLNDGFKNWYGTDVYNR